ncbi:MAG TPA: SpoIIE family protein phosphatase [Chitinivibrionales bacterium]|nr:SpoIIE family protein phosphatase [Chitinivibrionales bacterium]
MKNAKKKKPSVVQKKAPARTDMIEQKAAEDALHYRLEFEKLITSISTTFINLAPEQADSGIANALGVLGEFTKTDRSYVLQFDKSGDNLERTYEWCAIGIESQSEQYRTINAASFPWLVGKLRKQQMVQFSTPDDLPPEAKAEKTAFKEQEIRSLINVPMVYGGSLRGVIGLESIVSEKTWSRDSATLLKMAGEIFSSTLERKRVEEELAYERDLLHTLMDNLPDTIYFKDTESKFTRINKAQAKTLGIQNTAAAIGKSDFDFFVHDHARIAFAEEQEIMKTGKALINKIEKVGRPDGAFTWFTATKVPIFDKNGTIVGTVGVSRDITKMKEFEDELQKAKNELEIRVAERTADLKKANERLEARIAQLDFLNSTSFELAQLIQMDDLLPAILRTFSARVPLSHASICKIKKNSFKCANATGILNCDEGRDASENALSVFLRSDMQKPLIVENWARDPRLSQYKWPDLSAFPCYVAIPLLADNQCLAAVQFFTTPEYLDTYEQEQTLLSTHAAHAAACLSNAIHYQELGEKARLDGELDAARSIQRRFTPQYKPQIPRINLKGVYYPAYEVGGDYLDYFKTESGDWVVVIADVCGKGIPAALLMTMLRSTFRVEGRSETSAKRLLCAVNDFMTLNLDDRSFVTALCLIIKANGTSMSYARAGHPMLLKLSSSGEPPIPVISNGLALGLVSDTAKFTAMMDEVNVDLKKGDRFLIYTDGLIDANNPERNSYGVQRLNDVLGRDKASDADALIAMLMDDIKRFTRNAPYHDDLTILALQVTE